MKKLILTKYCLSEIGKKTKSSSFEKKFESYIEKKVKKIINNPQNYPFIKVIDGDTNGQDKRF
ncbi:hypothetical protein [Streptococcus sp. sy018]|uniref:hypothetical protein n=1 Tax=Streptococcus sp. sy018 TaxID=2600147 RepID=UPI0011B3E19D|nr:hypothetical protein [Streptococcus sp. sy018]TWS95277.1 hypothetical protein FRX52_00290 [Streptococcus sp. sy018]